MSLKGENRQDAVGGLKRIGIEPYFAGGGVALYHGEELDMLPHLPADSVDALITDPPYCSGAATSAGKAEDPVKK